MDTGVTLEQLMSGQRALIASIDGVEDRLKARMLALGLRRGREVAVIRRASLGGPLHIRVGSTDLMLRRREARLIHVTLSVTET
jgi:ferrous iron transport protein A